MTVDFFSNKNLALTSQVLLGYSKVAILLQF